MQAPWENSPSQQAPWESNVALTNKAPWEELPRDTLSKPSVMFDITSAMPRHFLTSADKFGKTLGPTLITLGKTAFDIAKQSADSAEIATSKIVADPLNLVNHLSEYQAAQNSLNMSTARIFGTLLAEMGKSVLKRIGLNADVPIAKVAMTNGIKIEPSAENILNKNDPQHSFIPPTMEEWKDRVYQNIVNEPFETTSDLLTILSFNPKGLMKGAKYTIPGTPVPKTTLDKLEKISEGGKFENFVENWNNFQKTDLMKIAAQDKFYTDQSKAMNLIVKHTDGLSIADKAKFGQYVSGVEALPEKISPKLQEALRFWDKLDSKNKNYLTNVAGSLDKQTVDMRAWKIAVAKKVGKPFEVINNANDAQKSADLMQITTPEFWKIVNDIKKENKFVDNIMDAKPGEFLTPKYFPFKEENGKIVQAAKFGPKEESFLKKSTAASYLQDAYEKDPAKVMMMHQAQVNRMKYNHQISKDLLKMETTIPFHGTSAEKELLKAGTHELFNPEGWLDQQNVTAIHNSLFLENMEKYGDIAFAANKTNTDLLPIVEKLLAEGKPTNVYLVPKKVMETLRYVKGRNPDELAVLAQNTGKGVYDAWRWAVLQARPKWAVNNVVGGSVMAGLASGASGITRPTGLGKNINRFVPEGLVDNYFMTIAPAKTSIGPVGKYTNFMSKLNYDVDNFFRTNVYMDQAQQFAAKNLMTRTGKKTFTSNELTKELLRMKTSEPAQIQELIKYVNDFMPDFQHMTSFEREFIRTKVPFWGFVKHQLMLDAKLLYKYPERGALIRGIEKTAESLIPQEHLAKFKDGQVFIGQDTVTLPTGAQVPVNRYLDTRGNNPLIIGAPLMLISPFIKAPIEYMMQRSLTTGMEFESPYAVKVKGGFIKLDASGNPYFTKRPVGMDYVAMSQIPYTSIALKYMEQDAKSQGKNVLKYYKIKSLPETLLNTFALSTTLDSPRIEKMKLAEQYIKENKAIISAIKSKPEFRQRLQNNSMFMKQFQQMRKDALGWDDIMFKPDNESTFKPEIQGMLQDLQSNIRNPIPDQNPMGLGGQEIA